MIGEWPIQGPTCDKVTVAVLPGLSLRIPLHRTAMISTTDRLTKLRELMASRGLQAYFVPSEDAHQVY